MFWYERVIHDHLAWSPEEIPGSRRSAIRMRSRHVEGYGLFTIPHGPVPLRASSESIEYLVETPGRPCPHLDVPCATGVGAPVPG